MFSIIDYRNGRYQGQINAGHPHGIGIFMDRNLMFVVAEWQRGTIEGSVMVVYESGRIFCGHISNQQQTGLCSYQLVEDHVKLMRYVGEGKNVSSTMAAVLPLHKLIFQIDNSSIDKAFVKQQYAYSLTSQQQNFSTVSRILKKQASNSVISNKEFFSHRDCVQFFIDKFYNQHPNHFEYYCRESKNKKEYFMGLKEQGLGLTIQPIEQLKGFVKKKTGQVYFIRSMGTFTKDNTLKEFGVKIIDNVMKGFVYQEGVFSRPETLIKYEMHNRPQNCRLRIINELKQSMFFRDAVLDTEYIQNKEYFIKDFDAGLRTIRTQQLAQKGLEIPNNRESVVREIQEKRQQKMKRRQREDHSKTMIDKDEVLEAMGVLARANTGMDLGKVKHDIQQSANKRRNAPNKVSLKDYREIKYIDPDYKQKNQKTIQRTRQTESRTRQSQPRARVQTYQPTKQFKSRQQTYESIDYQQNMRNRYKYDEIKNFRNQYQDYDPQRNYQQRTNSRSIGRNRMNGSISPTPNNSKQKSRYKYLQDQPEQSRKRQRDISQKYQRDSPQTKEVAFSEHPVKMQPSRRIYHDTYSSPTRASPKPYPRTEQPKRKNYQYMFDSRQVAQRNQFQRSQNYDSYQKSPQPIQTNFSPSRYNKKTILSKNLYS